MFNKLQHLRKFMNKCIEDSRWETWYGVATFEKRQIPNTKKEQTLSHSCWTFQNYSEIGENAYKFDLPAEYGISNTFNIGDHVIHEGEDAEHPELGTIRSKYKIMFTYISSTLN